MLEDGVDAGTLPAGRGVPDSRISFAEAFWMATAGGGAALGLPIGLLDMGYRFDAIAVSTSVADSDLRVWPDLDSDADLIQKIINNAGPHDMGVVWVDGRRVLG
jgi:guanine deaminase